MLNHKPLPWRWAGDKGTSLLRIVGTCDQRLFGLEPAERLKRQRGIGEGPVLVAHASVVLSDPAVAWLMENPGQVLTTPQGRAAAIGCDAAEVPTAERWIAEGKAPQSINPARIAAMFIRKLRRRDTLLVRSLEESAVGGIERELFDSVYKGVTDLVTKYAWPIPAFWATKLCTRFKVPPNAVTVAGIASAIVAAWLWAGGSIVPGLAFAWLMTFLDTVDGKLARTTVTSSRLGNILDHATDILHPPVWWFCLAHGLSQNHPADATKLSVGFWSILLGYVAGRAIEELFKRRVGYNAYLWRPFDSAFRLIVSRRNVILLIVTGGLLVGEPVSAFLTAAAWTVLSVAVQCVRYVQAEQARRRGDAETWLR